jgi:hypothetical protein
MPVSVDSERSTWFARFLASVRRRAGEVSPVVAELGPFFDLMIPPAQIAAVYISGVDETVVLIFHLGKTSDGFCWAYKPTAPAHLLEVLDTIHALPELQEEVPPGARYRPPPPAPPTVSTLLEPELVGIHTRVKDALGSPMNHQGFGRYWPTLFVGWFPGDLTAAPVEGTVTRLFEEARSEAERMKEVFGAWPPPPMSPEELERAKRGPLPGTWLGTFLFPTARIGAVARKPLAQSLPSVRPSPSIEPDIVVEGVTVDRRWFATHEGFVAIKDSDRRAAAEWLNALGAAFVIAGIPASTVREHELCDVELSENTKAPSFSRTGIPASPRNYARVVSAANPPEFSRPAVLTPNQFKDLVEGAAVAQGSRGSWALGLILDAYTYRMYKHFGQSFISSWMVVEGFVDEEWERFLIARGVIGQRKNGLENVHAWTAHTKTETLALSGWITDGDYQEINWSRQRRNGLLHQVKTITPEEAERAFRLALDVCKRMTTTPAAKRPGP